MADLVPTQEDIERASYIQDCMTQEINKETHRLQKLFNIERGDITHNTFLVVSMMMMQQEGYDLDDLHDFLESFRELIND